MVAEVAVMVIRPGIGYFTDRMCCGAEINILCSDTSLVASHVTVLKSYLFIGLMGYSAGDNPLSYPETDFLQHL